MNQFTDLIQTSSVTIPILVGLLAVLGAIGVMVYFWPGAKDRRQEEADRQSNPKQEEHGADGTAAPTLENFYNQYDEKSDQQRLQSIEDPKQHMDTLNRGANGPTVDEESIKVINTPYADMAAKYGFECYKHYTTGELILFDVEIPALEVQHRAHRLPLDKLIQAEERELRDMVRTGRKAVNRQATKAGLTPYQPRKAGRPVAKEVKNT